VTSSSPQDQYMEAVRQSQDAVASAMQAWTDGVQKLMSGAATPGKPGAPGMPAMNLPRPVDVVDQVFDFAQAMLEAQRTFAKRLVEAAGTAAEQTQAATERAARRGAAGV
jgi:hypothetical protein